MRVDGIVHGVGICMAVEAPVGNDEFRGANSLEETIQFVTMEGTLLKLVLKNRE